MLKVHLARLLPLYVVIFFGFVGYSMMITLFTPLFMYAQGGMVPVNSSLEYRVVILGVVLAVFPLAQFLGSPILGALSDRYGRKPVLILSLCIAPACYALIAFSLMVSSLILLIVGAFLAGISQSNIAIAQSAIADIASKENRQRFFGYVYLSTSLAYIVGPLLGGKLADASFVPWFSIALPFWLVCCLLAGTLVWTQAVFQETKQKKETSVSYRHALTSLLTIFSSRKLRLLYLVNFFLYFSIFGFFRCYPMYIVNAFKLTASGLSWFIAWTAVPIVLVNLGLTGALSKRFSPRTLTIWPALLTGLFMILIIVPSSPNFLWLTLFFTSSMLALTLPACATMLSFAANPSEQGRVMGNNQSLQVAAEALSAFAGGLLASITVSISLIVFGLVSSATAILILLLRRKQQASGKKGDLLL